MSMIWKSFFNVLLFSFACWLTAAGQTDTTQVRPDSLRAKKKPRQPLTWSIDGIRLGTDFSYPVWMIFEPDDQRVEFSAELNVSNRFFAVLETGYSRIRSVRPPNSFEYINRGFYVRAGFDYNLLHRLLRDEALFIGMQYGQARFEHEIFYIVNDSYWGIRDLDFNDVPDFPARATDTGMSLSWVEATAGLKARIWKQFYAGYTFRFQFRLQTVDGENMKATSVPGFNKTTNGFNIGFGYHIWYQIPFRKKTKK